MVQYLDANELEQYVTTYGVKLRKPLEKVEVEVIYGVRYFRLEEVMQTVRRGKELEEIVTQLITYVYTSDGWPLMYWDDDRAAWIKTDRR